MNELFGIDVVQVPLEAGAIEAFAQRDALLHGTNSSEPPHIQVLRQVHKYTFLLISNLDFIENGIYSKGDLQVLAAPHFRIDGRLVLAGQPLGYPQEKNSDQVKMPKPLGLLAE